MQLLDHEKLDVYQTTMQLIILVDAIVKTIPKGNYNLIDQLERATSSILLNIAEGAGEFAKNEKIRFYRIARRSATESAAILDIFKHINLLEQRDQNEARILLTRIISMLTKMVKVIPDKQQH